jgi:DNA-binding NarL/FixJ family response regulator
MTIRVVVADDQVLVRSGFTMLLSGEPDIDVVGEASNGAEAVALAASERPDVILMDVRMPVMDGLEATLRITGDESLGATRVVILTTFDLDEYVYEALRAGASGFLLKDGPADQFVAAIRGVADGGALLAPSVTRRLIEQFARRPPDTAAPPPELAELTDRELSVLKLLARGLSNAELAAELILGEATVKTHVARVLSKVGLRDRTQAVVYAYESGLVHPGEAVQTGPPER